MGCITELQPTIEELVRLSGTAGLSIGVLRQGFPVHTAHYGRRSDATAEDALLSDETVYYVASLTKIMSAAVVSNLVARGRLEWETPIRFYLPEFQRPDDVGRNATVIDLLSNRTGLAAAELLFAKMNLEFLTPPENIVETACCIDTPKPFRQEFVYSSWNYGLLTALIERVSGKNYAQCVEEMVFKPLQMLRSSGKHLHPGNTQNIVNKYALRDDGSFYPLQFPQHCGSGFDAAASCCSTIKDLLVMYGSLMQAYNHQQREGVDLTPGSPFSHARTILTPHVSVQGSDPHDFGYCLGTYRTRSIRYLGKGSINSILSPGKAEATIDAHSSGTELFFHSGNLPGTYTSMIMIPALETAIVVLTNTSTWFDVTDHITRLVALKLLGKDHSEQICRLATAARSVALSMYSRQQVFMQKQISDHHPSLPLHSYEGTYYQKRGNLRCIIRQHGNHLTLEFHHFRDFPVTQFQLHRLSGNTFYWPPDREDEVCNKGMWPFFPIQFRKFTFRTNTVDGVVGLHWFHDYTVGQAEVFDKGPARSGTHL